MRLEFPWPPRELSPNQRPYWRQKYEAGRDYKHIVGWILRGATWTHLGGLSTRDEKRLRRPPLRLETLTPPVTAQVTFVNDRRRRDPDNCMAMLKALWDALVDVGLLVDDNKDVLTILPPKWEVGKPLVIVELEEKNEGND